MLNLESNLTDFSDSYVFNQSNITKRVVNLELNLAKLTAANQLASENINTKMSNILVENKNLYESYNYDQSQRLVIFVGISLIPDTATKLP